MRFKADENLPLEVAEVLRSAGHDVMGVVEQGLSGAPDPDVAGICVYENRILVTLDLDFADVRAYPPGTTPGVVVLRPASQSKGKVIALAQQLVHLLEREAVAGGLWLLDEKRLRIREE